MPSPIDPHRAAETTTRHPRDDDNPEGPYKRATSFFHSFKYAFAGIVYAFRTQRNFKIHATVTMFVVAAGLFFKVTLNEWEALAVVIGLVFQTELTNTAVEAIVDRISPEYHSLAKVAKDCSAAAVLVTAIASTVVGLAIFSHHVIDLLVNLGLPLR